MPLPKSPRLTDVQKQHIHDCKQQGFTHALIASAVGCTQRQVKIYLRHSPGPQVPITKSQYEIILRFQENALTVRKLAVLLNVKVDLLKQELAGAKSMGTKRVGQLQQLFDQEKPA